MRAIGSWSHFMSNTVTVAPRSSVDAYGKPSYGAAVSYQAHISHKRTLVRTTTGEQVESGTQIHINGSPAVLPTSQLTLSTADVGSTDEASIHPTILYVQRRFDGNGPHHVVIYL